LVMAPSLGDGIISVQI